jgi:hypothetical protein
MYAVAYEHPEGFGSVGFLAGMDPRHRDMSVFDPMLGEVRTLSVERAAHVISTETGAVAAFSEPRLVEQASVTEERMAANKRGVKRSVEVISGYPLAWQRVRRWREQVAPDWRTAALIGCFARSTMRRSIEEAESLYRDFGPHLREIIATGMVPGPEVLKELPGIKGTRADGFADVRAFADILAWAPWVTGDLGQHPEQKDRAYRDRVAQDWSPWGLGLAKLTFTLSLLGRDGACIDARILGDMFGQDPQAEKAATGKRSEAPGTPRFTAGAVATYRNMENKLKRLPYFDPQWEMPFARCQWMLWESLGRPAGPASHEALWEVLDPLVEQTGRA